MSGRTTLYVTAPAVMNRLDEVLGPENWWTEETYHGDVVTCRLTIRLPNGALLTKPGACGFPLMDGKADPALPGQRGSNSTKGGFSGALKLAAEKFGVGRYLRREGTPRIITAAFEPAPATAVTEPPSDPKPQPPKREDTRTYVEVLAAAVETCNRTIETEAHKLGAKLEGPELLTLTALEKALHTRMCAPLPDGREGLRPKGEDRTILNGARSKVLAELYGSHKTAVRVALRTLVDTFADRTIKKLAEGVGKGDAHEPAETVAS